jgi:hypothetical protein
MFHPQLVQLKLVAAIGFAKIKSCVLMDYGLIVVRFTSKMGMSHLKIINASWSASWPVSQS